MTVDFSKYADGLVPVVVQDCVTRTVLTVGFMNEEAYRLTVDRGLVTFYSRSKKEFALWGKTAGIT